MKIWEKLETARKPYCIPSNSQSSSAAAAEATSTVTTPADVPGGDPTVPTGVPDDDDDYEDCDDEEDQPQPTPTPAPAPTSNPAPPPHPTPHPHLLLQSHLNLSHNLLLLPLLPLNPRPAMRSQVDCKLFRYSSARRVLDIDLIFLKLVQPSTSRTATQVLVDSSTPIPPSSVLLVSVNP